MVLYSYKFECCKLWTDFTLKRKGCSSQRNGNYINPNIPGYPEEGSRGGRRGRWQEQQTPVQVQPTWSVELKHKYIQI